MSELLLYGVMGQDGKWFRRKGYSGYGESWVDDMNRARIYNKIGHARQIVSFFANKFPSYGVPSIVELKVSRMRVIDEDERVQKVQDTANRRAGIKIFLLLFPSLIILSFYLFRYHSARQKFPPMQYPLARYLPQESAICVGIN